MNKTKKVIGYMCEIDWDWELGEALGGNTIYSSLEDLKENHECWDCCGVVEVEVRRTINPEKDIKAKRFETNKED